ncbi:YgfZ/GcvT domain-containing protein [Gilvimarinus chinensis]|uniref:CAF17-like 4Fe-4S cluster assembly/insertion protein YgfZ n=1 Tax=Gilvimarinus chinensis TaxID=396005 RepID=UPI000368E149|nr:folate-binding protein YgfZ [Gilvimarinus chinensis]
MSLWHGLFADQGAKRRDDGGFAFPPNVSAPADTDTRLSPLSHQAFITLTGPDARKFLQGQVTCDVRELEQSHWLLGAQCNLKGRVIASFTLAALSDETLLLKTSGDLVETLLSNLKKYAVFSKVTPEAEGEWIAFGLSGSGASRLIEQNTGLNLADLTDNHFLATDSTIVLQRGKDRFELWVNADHAATLWSQLAAQCQLADTALWQLADTEAGIAEIRADTSEHFTPQDINYPLIGAVSFKKGCYTGQEVVARLHYKAKLKKHLYRIEGLGAPPARLASIVDKQGKNRGEIVQASATDKGFEALAVLPATDDTSLQMSETGGHITRLSLPYSIPSADNSD